MAKKGKTNVKVEIQAKIAQQKVEEENRAKKTRGSKNA
jgi:hypothetical protein